MVREIKRTELNDLLGLYTHLHESGIPEWTEHLKHTWETILRDPNHHIIVDTVDGRVVSSCVCVVIPNLTRGIRPYALIENVVTHPDYRGMGHATACLDFAKSIAVNAHCYKIMLLTGSRDAATLRFYERAGYNSREKTAFIQRLNGSDGTAALSPMENTAMNIEFRKITDFPRGTLYAILKDTYAFDPRCAQRWDEDWRQSDAFFFDHLDIADRYGFVTCLHGEPIGFITWDPRNRPEYVEIGHNGIRTAHKGRGFGKAQLSEALRRIRAYEGLKEIRVCTNANLVAPRNYESAGFVLYDRKENRDTPFTGDYLYYRIRL